MGKAVKKYHFLGRLTDDGRIDMFIIGADGIPVARIKEPTATGEEALEMARAWVAAQEEPEKELEDDVQQDPTIRPLHIVWNALHRLFARA
jgi:hypothetical protein